MPTLFDRLGGFPAITAAVDGFYERVLDDPELAPYFDDVSMDGLKHHQRQFLVAALGGPNHYRGRGIRAAHAGHGITEAAFDAVAAHLAGTLVVLGVPDRLSDEVISRLGPLRADVVEVPFPPAPPAAAAG